MRLLADVPVRIREAKGTKRLVGVIIAEGRAARGGRSELFTPGSISWPDSGISINVEHRGPVIGTAHPSRHPSGEIRISTPATKEMIRAVEAGKNGLSIEFAGLKRNVTKGGVTEWTRAYVDVASIVARPEYHQGVAKIRSRMRGGRTRFWL